MTVSEWDGYYLEGNRIKLSKEANDSVITLIRQHPEARVRDGEHYDRYGKGKMCSLLEVNIAPSLIVLKVISRACLLLSEISCDCLQVRMYRGVIYCLV